MFFFDKLLIFKHKQLKRKSSCNLRLDVRWRCHVHSRLRVYTNY